MTKYCPSCGWSADAWSDGRCPSCVDGVLREVPFTLDGRQRTLFGFRPHHEKRRG